MTVARLKTYFVETVLPHWLSVAFDDEAGQFVEGLELDGTPEKTGVVRVRTAARQIYVYAQASALGVGPEGGLAKAERAFANLRRLAWIAGAKRGYASTFNFRTGEIVNERRDLYDHACVLLALAWLYKATGKTDYLQRIDELSQVIDTTLAASFGGWAEDDLGSLPRRQNPHMHYFEACLALWETGAGERHAARAGELFGLFRTRLFDDRIGVLREFFGPAWQLGDDHKSDRLDPGHMAEWVWLIRRYDTFAGSDHSDICAKLLETAVRVGIDKKTPFLVDEADLEGRPLKRGRRLWLQAELLKAYIMQARGTGDTALAAKADDLVEALFSTYLAETPAGTWRDAFDLDGTFTATSIPGSSLYHLWSGVVELLEPAGR